MPPAVTSPPIVCSGSPLSVVETDLLIVPWFDGELPGAAANVDEASGGEVGRALTSKEFQAKPYDLFVTAIVNPAWKARRLVLIGGGRRAECSSDLVRKLASAAGLTAKQKRAGRVALVVRGEGDVAGLAQAIAEGLTLAEFDGGSYKTVDPS